MELNSCWWICIFICGPSQHERQWGLHSLLAPPGVFIPIWYKDTNFTLRPSRWRHGGKLKHPWASLNQTDRKSSCRYPCPHGDSHEFPQFHCLVGWLRIQRSSAVLPLNSVVKAEEGGQETEKIIFHSPSQHDPDNSRLPFLVMIKLPLCLKLHHWKKKQRSKWKGGASKVNPLQGRSEHPFFKEQKKIYLFSLSPLPLLCLAIKSGFYVHSNGWGSQNMHMNEEEPHGTNISLQTDLHIYRPRNGV